MTQSRITKTSAFALMVGLLFVAACGGGAEGADSANSSASVAAAPAADQAGGSTDGEQVYGSICVTCHQADGNGLQGAFPPLAGSAVAVGDAEVSIKIVLSGLTGEMTRIAGVLTYVRSNFGNSADAVTEAQVAEVRAATSSQTTPYSTDGLGIAGE